MELILSLRGSCSAKVKDIIDLRKLVSCVAYATVPRAAAQVLSLADDARSFRRQLAQTWAQEHIRHMQVREEHHANDSEHDGVVNDSKDNDAPSDRAYFFDAEVLKSEVRKRLFKDPYDV